MPFSLLIEVRFFFWELSDCPRAAEAGGCQSLAHTYMHIYMWFLKELFERSRIVVYYESIKRELKREVEFKTRRPPLGLPFDWIH